MKTIFVLFVDNKPKGILSEIQLENYSGRSWWTTFKKMLVPIEKIDDLNIGNVEKYLTLYGI
jgi:hypothetical protein